MALLQGKVVHLILQERFGPIVAEVGRIIFAYPCSLFHLRKSIDSPLIKIKEALSILIKFNLISFKRNPDGISAIYSLQVDNVCLMLRFPKFINVIKKNFQDDAETLLEVLLLSGCATASEMILKGANRLKEKRDINLLLPELKEKFCMLVNAKYIMKLPSPDLTEEQRFLLPDIDVKQLTVIANGGANDTQTHSNIYWMINADRFHQDLRDQLIVDAVTNKFDENVGELMRVLLQQMYIRTAPWVAVSNPIPILEVKEIVKKQNTHPQLIAFFEQYVSILEQDSCNVITKVGEASGGSFQIEMKQIFTQLVWEAVEHIVNEKFDTKASRIFRLVKSKKYIEAERIQNLVMVPAKEAKRISYQLLEENFLLLNELKRSLPGGGPNKSFTLFYIRLTQLVRTITELCNKTLFNLMSRRYNETVLNKRIIEKKQRVDAITLGMTLQGASNEQLEDIEEMITPPENEILEKIGKMMKKLSLAELEIDDTMFLLQMYMAYE